MMRPGSIPVKCNCSDRGEISVHVDREFIELELLPMEIFMDVTAAIPDRRRRSSQEREELKNDY
jgi:hypothetical protein